VYLDFSSADVPANFASHVVGDIPTDPCLDAIKSEGDTFLPDVTISPQVQFSNKKS